MSDVKEMMPLWWLAGTENAAAAALLLFHVKLVPVFVWARKVVDQNGKTGTSSSDSHESERGEEKDMCGEIGLAGFLPPMFGQMEGVIGRE